MPVFTCVGQSCSRPARLFKGLNFCSMQYSVCHGRWLFGENLGKGALSHLQKLSQTRLLLTHFISATSVRHCCVVCDVDNQSPRPTQNRELSLQLHACISALHLSGKPSSSHSPVQNFSTSNSIELRLSHRCYSAAYAWWVKAVDLARQLSLGTRPYPWF